MKKIILIGDSIRLGYENYVKKATKQIGDQILQVICKMLDIPAKENQIEDFVLPEIPIHILGA